jgi:hypothetical protein
LVSRPKGIKLIKDDDSGCWRTICLGEYLDLRRSNRRLERNKQFQLQYLINEDEIKMVK